MVKEEVVKTIGEIVDRLITVPVFSFHGSLELYNAARNKFKDPLTFLAASEILKAAKKGDTVIISTGFVCPPYMVQETDGPPGAAGLARAIDLGIGATPVIVTEPFNVKLMESVCSAGQLQVCDFEMAKEAARKVAIEAFPLEEEKAKDAAREMLDRIKPSAVITVEKASRNERGVYHTGVGIDCSALQAKVDHLVEGAKARGILTIGIGDGGNEIGMGCIQDTVKKVVPVGANCGCPCGAGNASATATDLLVVAAVSNWGCSGIETCLASFLDFPEVLHNAETELEMIRANVAVGGNHPLSGLSELWVDGIPGRIHAYIVEILTYIMNVRRKEFWGVQEYRAWTTPEKRPLLHEKILKWAEYFSKTTK